MFAVAVFTNAAGSHAFQERRVVLSEPTKIGRSVAQARPAVSNTIFDCKVLSRNHALLWYDSGKFYLQDTKSSNGTFVNSQRLSKGSEESPPKEVFSGDTIQFGVDVMENSLTHNCIIGTLQLFHPNGQEATNSGSATGDVASHGIKSNELYQLAQCLQEALHREQMLEKKLVDLQRFLQQTQEATECGWRALVDEDRLLSRLECLEDQLSIFAKGVSEESLRQQILELQSDKAKYESSTKDSLRHLLEEKLEAIHKVLELERSLASAEEECAHQREVCRQLENELHALADKWETQTVEVTELNDKLRETENKYASEQGELKEENHRLQTQLEAVIVQVESLQAENDFASEQLINMKGKLDCMKNAESPRICDYVTRGVQADIVSLADLHLLNDNEKSDDDDDEEKADVDNCRLESERPFEDQQFITLISANESDDNISHSANGDELRKLRSKLSSYKEQLSTYMSQLEDTQSLVGMLQQDLQNSEIEKLSQAKRIQCLEDELQMVELEKSSQYEKITLLEAQIKSLLVELDSCRQRDVGTKLPCENSSEAGCTELNGEIDVERMHQALERQTMRNKAEFQQLKIECAELRQRVQDIEQEMKQSRRQNEDLKADYGRLQESYRQLEQLKNQLEDTCHLNLTDAQKDVELTRTQLSTAQRELSELHVRHRDEISALRSQLDSALDEYSTLSYNATVVSYCSSIPLAILLFIIAIAFHPVLSMLTATSLPPSLT